MMLVLMLTVMLMLMLVTNMLLQSRSGIVTMTMIITMLLDGDVDGNALVWKGVRTLRCVI